MAKIRIGIAGFGNLGKGVEKSVSQNPDMELVAVFSRRSSSGIVCSAPVYPMADLSGFKNKIDVMILCGGSATDLPVQSLEIAQYFHTVDSFDNHAQIPEYFKKVDNQAKRHEKLSLISTGWDPGLFSLMRALGEAVLPQGNTYTFWGKGLSQGHSDAIRRVPGVRLAAQYTLPDEGALDRIRAGQAPDFTPPDMHVRECYVVLEADADSRAVERAIKTMPDYFEPYQTEVYFISESEFLAAHQAMPHGGKVLRAGESASGKKQLFESGLALESNPEFTASVLVAYARAVFRMSAEGKTGAVTVFDIPIGYLTSKTPEELRKFLL